MNPFQGLCHDNPKIRLRYFTYLVFSAGAGCFDINQTFELTDEGQATFRFLLAFDAEFLALAESEDMDMASVCQTEDFLTVLPGGVGP